MQTSAKGVATLEYHEDVVLRAYPDAVGIWTIGAGLTAASGVVKPKAGMVITAEQASALLAEALTRNYEPAVLKAMAVQYARGARQVAEDMGRQFGLREDPEGAGLIMAIKFTEEWYRLHMPPLKAAFEDDTIAIIKDAEHLSDLRTVKLIRGIARVPPTREGERGKRRHGDHAIALALAHYASRMRWVEYGYTPASAGRSGDSSGSMFDDDDATRDPYRPPLGARLRGHI